MRWEHVGAGWGVGLRLARRGCLPDSARAMCMRLYSVAPEHSAPPTMSWTRSVFRVLAWVPVVMFVTSHVCSVANVHGHSMSVRVLANTSLRSTLLIPSSLGTRASARPVILCCSTAQSPRDATIAGAIL